MNVAQEPCGTFSVPWMQDSFRSTPGSCGPPLIVDRTVYIPMGCMGIAKFDL